MKKLLPIALVLALVAGVPGAWAKNSFSGKSFGSSSFKSIRQMGLPSSPRALAAPQGQGLAQRQVAPAYQPSSFIFLPIPMFGGGGTAAGGFDSSWLLVIVIGAVVLFFVVRRRVPARGPEDEEESQTLEVMYERCSKNLDTLATTYLDAQAWLERLEGKIPAEQWKDWNDMFTRVSIDDFTKQLKDIRAALDQGRDVAARAALYSFDEDAVAVFEFFREMENTLEEVG